MSMPSRMTSRPQFTVSGTMVTPSSAGLASTKSAVLSVTTATRPIVLLQGHDVIMMGLTACFHLHRFGDAIPDHVGQALGLGLGAASSHVDRRHFERGGRQHAQ